MRNAGTARIRKLTSSNSVRSSCRYLARTLILSVSSLSRQIQLRKTTRHSPSKRSTTTSSKGRCGIYWPTSPCSWEPRLRGLWPIPRNMTGFGGSLNSTTTFWTLSLIIWRVKREFFTSNSSPTRICWSRFPIAAWSVWPLKRRILPQIWWTTHSKFLHGSSSSIRTSAPRIFTRRSLSSCATSITRG